MIDFDTASSNLLAWFKTNGGHFRDDLLAIQDLRSRGAGRGIVAIKDIPKDTVLFTIPRPLILNVETSELTLRIPGIFDSGEDDQEEPDGAPEPLDSWAQLILVLLYEYLQGEASKWKPYFDVLPITFDTPIFWSDAELRELDGTCLTSEKIGKEESDRMLKTRILPIVQKYAETFYPDGASALKDDELLALAHRMGSTIMAYAFDLENDSDGPEEEEDGWVEDREGKTMLGMVPLADTLNADATFNAHVNHGDSLEITALQTLITAGDEILNYYGPLPSSELLRRYGYLTPEHHRYDVVEIPWTLVRSALAKQINLTEDNLLKADDSFDEDELEEYFIIERDAGSPDEDGQLHQEVKISELCPELQEQFKVYYKAIKKHAPDLGSDKRKRDDIYDSVLAEVLATKLESYPTNIEQDERALFGPENGDQASKRRKMAIEIRLGEKMLLREALAVIAGETEPDYQYLYRHLKKVRT